MTASAAGDVALRLVYLGATTREALRFVARMRATFEQLLEDEIRSITGMPSRITL